MAIGTQPRTFDTRVNISPENRNRVIDLLNTSLASTVDLKTQAKFAHWNVKGLQFFQVHELFDTVAKHAEGYIDLIAERATALGGIANGTVRQAAKASSLPEYDLNAITAEDHLRVLSERLANYANSARAAIDQTEDWGDQVTSDLFIQIAREADKDLWFLEAHLQAGSEAGQLRRAS
ncbi:MAG TPA: DNA starvation/stationary phase protection protein Dps [Terriglobales bacterium]|nr:DNA starvation/stationary phase protection protein Dps [Terriglobales bacterium]